MAGKVLDYKEHFLRQAFQTSDTNTILGPATQRPSVLQSFPSSSILLTCSGVSALPLFAGVHSEVEGAPVVVRIVNSDLVSSMSCPSLSTFHFGPRSISPAQGSPTRLTSCPLSNDSPAQMGPTVAMIVP